MSATLRLPPLLLLLLFAACSDAPPAAGPDGAATPDAAVPDAALDAPAGACGGRTCRGDELCAGGACVPWAEAPLSVDFEATLDPARPRRVRFRVATGGFPRERAEEIRFTLGDGASGFGEAIAHEYAEPGAYLVDLEVRLEGYRVLRRSRVVAAPGPDGAVPARAVLTVDELPDYLNGSRPFSSNNRTPRDPSDDYTEAFRLLVPRSGFSIDVTLLGALDRGAVRLTADAPLGDGAVPAGADLAGRLRWEDEVPRAQWRVAPGDRFPVGPVTLTLEVGAERRTLGFDVVELGPERDPFARPMQWLFRFDLDLFTLEAAADGSVLTSVRGPNGVPDFEEELAALGAGDPVYQGWIKGFLVAEVYRIYRMAPDGAPRDDFAFTITHDGLPDAPDPATFSPAGAFSMMRFGGTFRDALGYSDISVHAQERIDDTGIDRGVATARILDVLARTPIVSDALAPILPELGTPVGQHPEDARVLGAGFDPHAPANAGAARDRHDDLRRIARFIALAIATVTAHEMGHAMGLVPNGPPPEGFFGDRADVDFMGDSLTNPFHADYPPVNLMQAGGDLGAIVADGLRLIELPEEYDLVDLALAIALETRLSPYELAYFRRRITYGR